MMNRRKAIIFSVLAAAGAAVVIALLKNKRTIPEGVTAIKPFDIRKYMGKWYEIARFDFRYEKNLDHTTAEYKLNDDGTVQVVNRGRDQTTAKWKQATGKAKFVDRNDEAMLKVSFFGPFYAGYNVIAMEGDYQQVLVSGDSKEYLWILSRTPEIPSAVKDKFVAKASSLGFDTGSLVWVNQH